MPDDLDDESSPEDLDDIDEAFDEDLDDDLDADEEDLDDGADDDEDEDLDGDVSDEGDEGDDGDGADRPASTLDTAEHSADEEDDDLDLDEDDVEASLDVILKERLVVPDDVPDDDEAADTEERGEPGEHVLPKQPDEFVCRSCFLVKHPGQLADVDKMLCRDCV